MKNLLFLLLLPFAAFSQTIQLKAGDSIVVKAPQTVIQYRDTGSTKYIPVPYPVHDTVWQCPPVTPPTPSANVFPIRATVRTDDYNGPLKGFHTWNYSTQISTSSEYVYYRRYTWYDFDKGVSGPAYNWTMLDNDIQAAIKAGKTYAFAVMPLFSGLPYKSGVGGGSLSFPEWVHNAMQRETTKDWIYSGKWIINWNSPAFQNAYGALLQAIVDRIKAKGWSKYVEWVDIRGYGDWGEWHTDVWTGQEPAGARATAESLKKIVDIYLKCFPDYQLIAVANAFDPGNYSRIPKDVSLYILNARNNVGLVGWRVDHWGNPGLDVILSKNPNPEVAALITERWKYAPIVGEPNNQSGDYYDLPREVKAYGLSTIGNGNFGSTSAATNNAKIAVRSMGYKIGIDSGYAQLTDKLYITAFWSNKGVAPTYTDWQVTFQIGSWTGKSSFNPKLFLPGSKMVVDQFTLPTLAAGTYQMSVTITDPTGARKPLPLNTTIKCEIKL